MAYQFNDANAVVYGSLNFPGYPVTMACRFRMLSSSDTLAHVLFGFYLMGTGTYKGLYFIIDNRFGGAEVRRVSFVASSSDNWTYATSTTAISDTNWHTAIGVASSDTSRTSYGDNANGVTSSANLDMDAVGLNMIVTGCGLGGNTPITSDLGDNVGHEVCETAVWTVALSADDRAAYQAGRSPLLIRPQNLIYYAPLVRELVDRKGVALTNNAAAATVVDHPRVVGIGHNQHMGVPAAAAGSIIPLVMHHRRQQRAA